MADATEAKTQEVKFIASFPTGGTPIKIGADTMSISLEIPRSELANGLELIALQEMALMVTVRPLTKAEWAAHNNKGGNGAT